MKNYVPRKRWHTKDICDEERFKLRAEARKRITTAADPNANTMSWSGLSLVRGVDLRATLEEKALSVCEHTKWTAFVNKAGTLCHFVPREGDLHTRAPLYFSTNGLSDKRLEGLLYNIIAGRFV